MLGNDMESPADCPYPHPKLMQELLDGRMKKKKVRWKVLEESFQLKVKVKGGRVEEKPSEAS